MSRLRLLPRRSAPHVTGIANPPKHHVMRIIHHLRPSRQELAPAAARPRSRHAPAHRGSDSDMRSSKLYRVPALTNYFVGYNAHSCHFWPCQKLLQDLDSHD